MVFSVPLLRLLLFFAFFSLSFFSLSLNNGIIWKTNRLRNQHTIQPAKPTHWRFRQFLYLEFRISQYWLQWNFTLYTHTYCVCVFKLFSASRISEESHRFYSTCVIVFVCKNVDQICKRNDEKTLLITTWNLKFKFVNAQKYGLQKIYR